MSTADVLANLPVFGQRHVGPIDKPAHRFKPPAPAKPRQKIAPESTNPERLTEKRAEQRAWKLVRDAAFTASGGKCVVKRPDCTKTATEGHHVLGRAVGGNSKTSVCLPTCWTCHVYLTRHRTWAYESGLLERSWEAAARLRAELEVSK